MSNQFEFREIEGDLFSAPENYSLAHCVSEDMRMGAGIATIFKKRFGQVEGLRAQNVKPGGVAMIKDCNRFVYYMVTKAKVYNKPTYRSLSESLHAMKDHMKANDVTKLAIPRIGCGLDGLDWDKVKDLITETFQNEAVEIVVYTYTP